jgi:hypothetical protein
MEKITRSQFIQKYGFDPHDKSSYTQQAPTNGAIGGSSEPKQMLTPDEVANAISQQPQQTLSADEVAKISGAGTQTPSDYKPGKFIQALEDIRPDYIAKGQGSGVNGKRTFGDIYHNIGEGMADTGVGIVKGATRMPVNIVQALTPDSMWGDNSLLNSESERAKAFESATKGKTGLQKLGATSFDVASMFTPVGLEKGGATLAGLAGKGALSGTERLLAGNTGRLANIARKVAPSIGETVAGSAMLGSDDSLPTDVGIAVVAPYVPKIINGIRGIKLSPSTIASLSEITGSSKMADDAVNRAIEVVNKNGPEMQKSINTGRKIMSEIVKPSQIGTIFGDKKTGLVTEDAMRKFNEASDVIMHTYLPYAASGGKFDWSKANTKLLQDEMLSKTSLDKAEKVIGNIPVNTSNIISDAKSQLGTMFKKSSGPTVTKAIDNFDSILNEYIATPGLGTKASRSSGILPLASVDGMKQKLWALKDAATTPDEGKIYTVLANSLDKANASHANQAGLKDAYDLYLSEKGNYSFLQDIKKVMKTISNSKNPEATSQLTSHIVGLISGSQFGPLAYYPARLLSKIFGDTMANRAINSLHSDPIKSIQRGARAAENASRAEALTNSVSKNKYQDLVISQMKRGPKSTAKRSGLAEIIAKQK